MAGSIGIASALNGAKKVADITDRTVTHTAPKGIFVGATKSIQLNMNGTWVTFPSTLAVGVPLALAPIGARIDSSTNCTAGDVFFLY